MIPNPVEKAFYAYGEFYETKSISKTRKTKVCGICYEEIPVRSSHIEYKFYGYWGDFPSVPICTECEEKYKEELSGFRSNGISSEIQTELEELDECTLI